MKMNPKRCVFAFHTCFEEAGVEQLASTYDHGEQDTIPPN